MSRNNASPAAAQAAPVPPQADGSAASGTWVTDRAWICGVAGALSVVLIAYWYNRTEALRNGLSLFGANLTDNKTDTLLAALFMVAAIMVLIEGVRLWLRSPREFFVLSPDVENGHYIRLFVDALANYLLYLALFAIAIAFYHSANEYGFHKNAPYYQPWFRFLDIVWNVYLWAGLPYAIITRAFKHDPQAEQRDLTRTFTRVLYFFISFVPAFKKLHQGFDERDKKNARALLVKMFFAPLMTVFFCDQFQHLVGNVGYVLDGLPSAISSGIYTHDRFNRDLFNISMALIFSIDVALAWCGYIVASRWLDNQTASAEPTLLGWMVCIACYPPFQMALGLYFTIPGDRAILQMPNATWVSIFTLMMVASYVIYMSATLWFGVRFSNLTNRGIIRKGPYAIVRHPAYASKNFAWWCVMFPYIIYSATHTGIGVAAFHTLGLIFMTGFYYLRAITEERHLLADPYYQAYCQKVKHRFVPGLI